MINHMMLIMNNFHIIMHKLIIMHLIKYTIITHLIILIMHIKLNLHIIMHKSISMH